MSGDLVPMGHNRPQVRRLRRLRRRLARADKAREQLAPDDDDDASDDAARPASGPVAARRAVEARFASLARPSRPATAEIPDVRRSENFDALAARDDRPLYVRSPREAEREDFRERAEGADVRREDPTRAAYLRATASSAENFGLLSRRPIIEGRA